MINEPNLLPCPFCGVVPVLYESREGWWIDCNNDSCPCTPVLQGARHRKEDAIEAWNTRTEDLKTKAMREAIKEIL